MPIVAIVGRPNVGKSTLFNRLIGQRASIVDECSGVTRDRIYGTCEWNGREFTVIDTGGYVKETDDIFEKEIKKQVVLATEEAHLVLFLVDSLVGLTSHDQEVAAWLRTSQKPYLLVSNKADNHSLSAQSVEFYSLGVEHVFPISSINGSGTGDLLDAVVKALPNEKPAQEEGIPQIAVVGRPNAGKSSLINSLMGKEQQIVTDIPGTTRDAIASRYTKFGYDFFLVDTAGIRKKKQVHNDLEFYSVMRSVRAVEYCDVAILMVDATRGFEGQDLSIFYLIVRKYKGVVIAVNKWDLVEKETQTMKHYCDTLSARLAPFEDVPILFISATERKRVLQTLDAVMKVYNNRKQVISTAKLNEEMLPVIGKKPPPSWKGKFVHIKYITQIKSQVPTFAFFCNLPQYIREPYKRYLENSLRKKFDLTGSPIRLFFRKK